MFDKSSVFDSDPLYKTITDVYALKGSELKRRFVVTCVDVNTGNVVAFNETAPDVPMAAVSSSSIPSVFQTRIWPDYDGGVVCMDGGTVWNINVASAVQRCREVVDDDKDIILDVIDCFPKATLNPWEDRDSALANKNRWTEVKHFN